MPVRIEKAMLFPAYFDEGQERDPDSQGTTLRTKGTLFGRTFWARGYCVSTVGLDEATIREYIKNQERVQREYDQKEFDLNK